MLRSLLVLTVAGVTMTSPPSHWLVGGPKPVRPSRTIIVKGVHH